jgi:hypothetical protein
MLPLYMQDEMYRKSLLLVTETSMRTEIGSFDRRTVTVVNYGCPSYLFLHQVVVSKSILQDPMESSADMTRVASLSCD